MATTDTWALAGQIDGRPRAQGCEAHELKHILNTIADQIADADRRHSLALDDMHKRLTMLGDEAKVVRAHAPQEMVPALDNIESRMAELADKITETDEARRTYAAAESAAASEPPAALRSALVHDHHASFTRRDDTSRAGGKPAVDTFDVVGDDESVTDDQAWDFDSAEALTRLYESGDANLAAGPAFDDAVPHLIAHEAPAHETPVHESPAVEVTAPVISDIAEMRAFAAQDASAVHAQPAHHASSIEDKFADLAGKVEHALIAMRPDASVSDLGARFTLLEEKLGAVIDAGSSRVELSSLHSIETQVEDLTARLESVHLHFSRLDSIELELRALADQVNDENLTRVFQSIQPRNVEAEQAASRVVEHVPRIESALEAIAAQLTEERLSALAGRSHAALPDTNEMAALVASKIAEQMPKSGQLGAGSLDRIEDMRALLNNFIDEQRHGDEQTTTMLDTMQQALIRLLDRMDSIETGVHSQPATVGNHAEHVLPMAVGMGDVQAYAPRQPVDMPASPARAPFAQSEVPRAATPAAMAAASRLSPRRDFPATAPAFADHISPDDSDDLDEDQPTQAAAAGEESSPRQLNRDDFVAAARRAARQAAQSPAESPADPELTLDAPRPAVAASSAKPMPRPQPPKSATTDKDKAKSKKAVAKGASRQPSMMTIGLVCMIAVGASFMVARPYIASMTRSALDPAGVAAPQAPAAAPTPAPSRPAAPPQGEEEEKIDGTSGAKRSGLNAPSSIGEALPASNAFIPAALPVDAVTDGGVTGRIEEPAATAAPALAMPPPTIGPNSLRTAAANGDPSAEFEVGARFAEGKGVMQDLKQAVAWYQRSATKGFAAAQYRLASMFERGLGVKADLAKAATWYQRAAEQGNVKAMHNLAVLVAGRDGVPTDYGSALRWFTAAADHGLADSQFNLAIMYETGLGVAKDPGLAYKWFSIAARAGDAEASRRRDAMRSSLPPTEARAVDAEIEAWRPKNAEPAVNDTRIAGEAWKQRSR